MVFAFMALSTKMSQLGHFETIRTFKNMHWEHSSCDFLHGFMIMCGFNGMLEL